MAVTVDWAAHWRELVQAREAQAQRLRDQYGLAREDYWERRAEGFQRMTRSSPEPDRFLELVSARVTPESVVLDVGAGTGRYALPLARLASRIVAVDPSPAMLAYLQAETQESGLTNITILQARWEELPPQPCDVALCSHVLYAVQDIVPFLRKLDESARQGCFLAHRVTQFDAHLQELWQRIHGEPRAPEPSFIDLTNVLYQMGILPNVEQGYFGSRLRNRAGVRWAYQDLDDALERVREQLYLPPDSPHESLLRDYLRSTLAQEEGRLVWPDQPPMRSAIVWWSKG